jgi:hypothetical protein
MFAKDQIVSVYSDFIDNPIIIANLIQEVVMLCYDAVKFHIKDTNKNILKLLNLPEKNEASISKNLANFYQDNHSQIFKLDQ